ncbi:MAG TPA: thymidine phosphorylase [Patescibacteria group bacterium]|nr:thymidine phosphorylase [Patescibacteria group bacterium]
MNKATIAREAVQKKLLGKPLTYKEIFAIMDEIANQRFGDILTTYFAASSYTKGFSNEEIYYLTKAMIETGDTLKFRGIVADKHSIGGVPGTRTTLIVVPIVAAAGFKIPKSSSRAITTPGGTADDMEVLAPVSFSKKEIYKIVKKTNACIVWGGSVDIAPADDELIKVEEPLLFESYDKFLVSIMAKKIAFGATHLVIDLPYGKHTKVHTRDDAELVKNKFEYLAKKFNVRIRVNIHEVEEPTGQGIGPVLETRDAMKVLEQKEDRPLDLEKKSLVLSGLLLDLCLKDVSKTMKDTIRKKYGSGKEWAKHLLITGEALKKMKEIIKAQGGNSAIISEELQPGKFSYAVLAKQVRTVKRIHSKNITLLAKLLGAPTQKRSGILLNIKVGEKTISGEPLFWLYSESAYNLKEAKASLENFPVYEYE